MVVDGETRVYESSIINEYLDEAYPEPALMPAEPGRRALARIWIDYANVKYTPSVYKFLMEQDDEKRAALRADAEAVLRFMETEGMRKLGDGPYWMGQDLTLVDLAYYPFFERLCVLEHYRDFGIPDDCTRLKAWVETIRFRPSVKEIENPPDYYIERYARYASGKAGGGTARQTKSA